MIRDREPDVGKLLELLKTGHSSKITWDAFAAAGVMTQSLWELFEAASLTTDTSVLEEVCDKLLARLEKMGTVMSLLTEDDTDIIEGSPLPVTLPPGGTQQQTEARLQQQQYQLAVSHVLYMSTKVYDVPDDALLCLRIRCKYLGQTHPFTLQAFCNRAEEFTSHQTLLAGRLYRQALELVRQAPELEKDKLRNLTLTLMYKYACFLWKQKEQGSFNWDDPPFKWLRWNVGDKPKEDGRMEEAHQKLCKVLKRSSEERGDLHPFTITVRSSLATFLEEQGDVEGAAKEHEIALKASKTTLGGDHIDTFWSRLGLARCQARLGKYSGAVMLFVEALDKLDKVLQSDDKEQIRLQTEGNLADCLLGMGDLVKAELQYDKVFDMHDTMDPVMGPPLELKVNYARCLACQGKFTAAESEYREAFFKAYVGPQRHKEGEDPDGCRLQNDICMGLKDAIEKQSRIFDLEVEKKNAEERQRKEAEERQELGAGGAATAALTIPRNSGGALRRNGDSTGSGSGCSTTTTTSSSQPSIRNRQLQQSSINNGPPGRVPSARSQQ
ncbi:hypothetical protein Vafri_6341 [Volvox africanus]|nr:hypothetical protein Vafri_6341 [Volvox africanus]